MNEPSKVCALPKTKCMYTYPIEVKTGCGLCGARKGILNFSLLYGYLVKFGSFTTISLLFWSGGRAAV